ncbi:MAG: bifunctional oligoribonuclease/PAP phosphatase NrnA [bacterium]
MIDRISLERVRDCINRGQRFVLTTHVNPDGDGLGAQAALASFLNDLNKDVFIYNSSPVPENYKFLDPDEHMEVYDPGLHKEILHTADYILILDISDWNRLRRVGEDIRNLQTRKICVDHHPTQESFGDLKLVDKKACSTGEIVYDLIKFCEGQISPKIAEALYTCIMTDTGSFKFSNTNSRAFKISAELVECGMNPQKLYEKVYEHQSVNKIRLFGHAMRYLQVEENGKVAVVQVTQRLLKKMGAKPHDTEGFADYPRVIDGVEVSIIFVELDDSLIKISLRSGGNVIINSIAKKFGGGGHLYAAGAVIRGTIQEYLPKILKEVSFVLNHQ